MKVIDELDFSPHAYKLINTTEFTKEDENLINNIKNKHGYRENLHHFLAGLPNWIKLYDDFQRQNPRSKKEKALYTKTIKAAEELKKYIKNFSPSMRSSMFDIQDKNDPYKVFLTIEENITSFIQKCQIEKLRLKKDIGGKKSGSLVKALLWNFIIHYEFATGVETSCGWQEDKDTYVGNIYDFVEDIKPILEKMKINLGKDNSIGKYITDILINRRKQMIIDLAILLSMQDLKLSSLPNVFIFGSLLNIAIHRISTTPNLFFK